MTLLASCPLLSSTNLVFIPISTKLLKPNAKWMRDERGNYCIVGQILQALGVKVHLHIETPAHQGTIIAPLSVSARGRACNTELCINLLRLSESLSPTSQIDEANRLLTSSPLYLYSIYNNKIELLKMKCPTCKKVTECLIDKEIHSLHLQGELLSDLIPLSDESYLLLSEGYCDSCAKELI